MKIFTYAIAVTLLAAIVSCGGNNKKAVEKMIPVSNIEMTGSNAADISINGDVKVFMVHNDDSWSICALVPMVNMEEWDLVQRNVFSQVDLLDANYAQINEHFGLKIQNEDLLVSLMTSVPGTQKYIVFEPESLSSSEDYEKIADIVNRAEHLVLKLQLEESADSVSSSSSTSSKDWDSVLDEYERYMNQYIELYKKAMAGDISALASYVDILESAEKLSTALEDAEDEMTSDQLSRYLSITQKSLGLQ